MVVPLGEQRRKVTHLVAARADIPGFRDQLDLSQTRVVTDGLKQRRILTKRRRPPHHRGEVETKAVNVALVNPKRRHWRAYSTTPGWLRLRVFPQPVQLW